MTHQAYHDRAEILAASPTVTGNSEEHTRPCPQNPSISCSGCRLSDLCLPISLNKGEIRQLDDIIERSRPLRKGEHLYRQKDSFRSIFAIRTGSFKSYVLGPDGQGRVTGFYMPGEIMGMDGIADRHYSCLLYTSDAADE